MSPTVRRLTAWLVLFAMALSSAAPSFASRASAADLAALGICSAAAQELAGQQSPDDPGPLASDLHHCPLCAPAAHAALPVALPQPSLPPADLPSFGLPRMEGPGQPVYAGSIWRPRGPPGQA
jgi:hypothetical protein